MVHSDFVQHYPVRVSTSAGPSAEATARRRGRGAAPRLDSRAAALLATALLLAGTVPVADGQGPGALAVAVTLSLAGGLSLRRPVTGALVIGAVLTLALGLGPVPVGTGVLASPLAVAALAAHGRPRLAIAAVCWHVLAPATAEVMRGGATDAVIAQVMTWLLLELTALLGGIWGRAQLRREVAERARGEAQLAEQRRAIARELHDTGVRAMARVVMLAENGTAPGTEDPALLQRISGTAREGTVEMRSLLEELREGTAPDGAAPRPTADAPAADLEEILETLRRRLTGDGFTVHLHADGAPALPAGPVGVVDRCLTEIEAHVPRHADRGAPVASLLEVAAPDATAPARTPGVDIVVLNAVDEERPAHLAGGSGLTGVTERLAALGGTLHTEREGRMFLTRMAIPAEQDAA